MSTYSLPAVTSRWPLVNSIDWNRIKFEPALDNPIAKLTCNLC
jgi:hypothetical protein